MPGKEKQKIQIARVPQHAGPVNQIAGLILSQFTSTVDESETASSLLYETYRAVHAGIAPLFQVSIESHRDVSEHLISNRCPHT